jgi:aminopeptidase N
MFYSHDDEYFNFERTPVMSTYLIAFIVSDFKSGNTTDNFHAWARESAITQVNYSVNVGPSLIKAMEDFLDLNYLMPKMDVVAVPDFSARAMENWGLTTYR